MAYRDRMAYLSNRLGVPSCDVRRNPLVLSRSLRLEGPFSPASLESPFSIDFQQIVNVGRLQDRQPAGTGGALVQ